MVKKKSVAIGTVLAAGAGYLVGVLTAPKSGRETRKDIRKAALQAVAESERKLKKAHSELDDLISKATETAQKGKEKADAEMKKAVQTAQTARQKARELLSALHEGEASDTDLKDAIEEAKSAISHLKKFVVKSADKATK